MLRRAWQSAVVAGVVSGVGICISVKVAFDDDALGEHPHLALGVCLVLGFAALLVLAVPGWAIAEGVAKNVRGMQVLVNRSDRMISGTRPDR